MAPLGRIAPSLRTTRAFATGLRKTRILRDAEHEEERSIIGLRISEAAAEQEKEGGNEEKPSGFHGVFSLTQPPALSNKIKTAVNQSATKGPQSIESTEAGGVGK